MGGNLPYMPGLFQGDIIRDKMVCSDISEKLRFNHMNIVYFFIFFLDIN